MIIETAPRPSKRSHRSNEGRIQAECFAWFWNTYPRYRRLMFHVPNENDRADSNPIQGAMRKSLGVVAGVSDLILLLNRGGHGALLIEMKDEQGAQNTAQKEWQRLVEAHGYLYRVCRNLEEFKKIVVDYLALSESK